MAEISEHLRALELELKIRELNRPSKLGAFADKLAGWLKVKATKSREQKRTT